MKKSFILLGLAVSCLSLNTAIAQSIGPSTLNQTGGSATIGGDIFDWSVGEMTMVSTFSGPSVIVTQGVLQSEVLPSGKKEISLAGQLQVFPNPASSVINVQFSAVSAGSITCKLMDMTGKTMSVKKQAINQGTTTEQIDISRLAVATYLLNVSFNAPGKSEETTNYKIEKLK
jgi:hypothetical protein